MSKKRQNFQSNEKASDLVSSLLEETSTSAQDEQNKLRAQQEQLRQQRAAQQAQKEAQKQEQARLQMAEEEQRKLRAQNRREAIHRAAHGPSQEELDAKAKAEQALKERARLEAKLRDVERKRAEAERRATEAHRKAQQQEQILQQTAAHPPVPTAAPKTSRVGLWIGAGAMVMVFMLTAAAGVTIAVTQTDAPQAQTFSRVAYTPQSVYSMTTETGFSAIPTAATAQETKPQLRNRPNRWKKNPKTRTKTKPNFGDLDSGKIFDGTKL